MNMFKKVKAKSVAEYLAAVPEERKELVEFVHGLMQKIAPKLKPYFANNMVGYGKFVYVNYKGEEIDWPVVAMANHKNYISVYVCALEEGEYVAEKYKNELRPVGKLEGKVKKGGVKVGKSCIRFKAKEEIRWEGFCKIIEKAVKNPGLVSQKQKKTMKG